MSADGLIDKRLDTAGRVTVRKDRIGIEGFEAEECGCREVAALAILWAIGELQRDLTELLAQPGGGRSVIEDGDVKPEQDAVALRVLGEDGAYHDRCFVREQAPDGAAYWRELPGGWPEMVRRLELA